MENAEKEKKKNLSVRSVPTRSVIENSNKIAKKFKKLKNTNAKIKNTVTYSFQAKKGWKRTRKSENKNCISVPFRSVPTRREIQNSKKREKNKKMPLWLHFKPKLHGKG